MTPTLAPLPQVSTAVVQVTKPKRHLRILNLFTPNRPRNHRISAIMMTFWIGMFLFFWITSDAKYFPTPIEVIKAFQTLWYDLGLGEHLWASMALNFTSIGIMFILTYIIAVLSRTQFFEGLSTLVSVGRFNGMIGLPMIFMSIFHNHHDTKIALLVFGMGVFTTMSFTKLFDGIPKDLFDHSRTLRMCEWRVIWEVVVLGTFDRVIDVLRINVAMGWMMLPMIEARYHDEGGVGALLEDQNKHLNLDVVFCLLGIILFVGFCQDYTITLFKKLICPSSEIGMEKK